MNAALLRYKHFTRRHYQDLLRRVPPARRRRAAAAAAARLAKTALFRRARTVGVSVSLAHELDTRPLLTLCAGAGKRVALPVVAPAAKTLRFALWTEGEKLAPNVYGILEPAAPRRWVRPDLVVVPGAAFTARRERLGSGGGYYDRYLARRRVPAVALAHAVQMAKRLPLDRRDRRLTAVITPDKIHAR